MTDASFFGSLISKSWPHSKETDGERSQLSFGEKITIATITDFFHSFTNVH